MREQNVFRNKMREKIKKYSNDQYLDGYIKNEFLTEDGDADIFLRVQNRDELFDSKTAGSQIDLAWEIYDFVEEKTEMLSNDIQINLHIIGSYFSSKEQEVIKHILKEHYAIELYKIQKQYVRYRNKIIQLICVGIFALVLYAVLYYFTKFSFALEILGFLFTFSLWEAFDCFLYTFTDIKNMREAISQNLLIQVYFDEN